jgi:hypothetical protein
MRTSSSRAVAYAGPNAATLMEQAKGVLIFRYGVDADTAAAQMNHWAGETGEPVEAIAHALVHDICQVSQVDAKAPWVVRWLERQLRHATPSIHRQRVPRHDDDRSDRRS